MVDSDIDIMSDDVSDQIDDICRCAYLVALAGSGFSETEQESLSEVRGYCRKFLVARPAMELLESTGNVKKARKLFDSDFPLIHGADGLFGSYLDDVQQSLSQVSNKEDYLEVVDLYASRITDRYLQLLTAFAAERVASSDDNFNLVSQHFLKRLFDSWEVSYQEYQFWYAKYATAIVFGHFYDKDISLGQFPEHDDSEEGNEEELEFLLNKMFDTDSIDDRSEGVVQQEEIPQIFHAVMAGDLESVSKALDDGADPEAKTNVPGMSGLTPLMIAADRGLYDIASLLLDRGANPNAMTTERVYTPLVWAVKGEEENTIALLLERGAQIEPFPDRMADWSPLAMAAARLLPDTVKQLVDLGANVNWIDPDGASPLKHACNKDESDNSIDTIRLLLDNGANPNLHDDEGFYPIHNAIDKGNIDTIQLLLDAGVSIHLEFPEESAETGSLLKRACINVNPEVIRLILHRLPAEKWVDQKNPVFLAFDDNGNPDIGDSEGFELIANVLRCGLKNGVDIEQVEESVRLLCEAGVKPDLVGLCFSFLYPDMAKMLIPYCKDDLVKLQPTNLQLVLGCTLALARSVEDGFRFFTSAKDLWFHATQALAFCGIEVPEGLEISEQGEDEDDGFSEQAGAFVDSVLDEIEERGGDRYNAMLNFLARFESDDAVEQLIAGKSEDEIRQLIEDMVESLVDSEENEEEDEEDEDEDVLFSVTLDLESEEDDDQPIREPFPFNAKSNSFLQASICIYLATSGDGYVNDEEIDGLIFASDELARLFDVPDDVNPEDVGVEAQRIVDAEFEDYTPIPVNLIQSYARKVAKKIKDPYLQKVVALLSLVTADADDELEENEVSVLNIYLDEWDLSWDEVQEVEGTF